MTILHISNPYKRHAFLTIVGVLVGVYDCSIKSKFHFDCRLTVLVYTSLLLLRTKSPVRKNLCFLLNLQS